VLCFMLVEDSKIKFPVFSKHGRSLLLNRELKRSEIYFQSLKSNILNKTISSHINSIVTRWMLLNKLMNWEVEAWPYTTITINQKIIMKIMRTSTQERRKSLWKSRILTDLTQFCQLITSRLSIMATIVSMKMERMKIYPLMMMKMMCKSKMKMIVKSKNGILMRTILKYRMLNYLRSTLRCKVLTCRKWWVACKTRKMTNRWYLLMKKVES